MLFRTALLLFTSALLATAAEVELELEDTAVEVEGTVEEAAGTNWFVTANLKEHVELKGRWLRSDPLHPKADWPGTGLAFSVVANAPRVEIRLAFRDCGANCNFYVQWSLNCQKRAVSRVWSGQNTIWWSFNAVPGRKYDITVSKRTESLCSDAKGTMVFQRLSAKGARFKSRKGLSACWARGLRMLVIGDSVTAGYGAEGKAPCPFAASKETALQAWAGLTAEALHADLHILAFSGKGVVRNYGDYAQISSKPFPVYYDRTLAMDSSPATRWNPSWYTPHLVAVMLGANDYSTSPTPSDGQFIGGLVAFLRRIKHDYPRAKVVAMCSPHHEGKQCQNIQAAANQAGVHYVYVDHSAYVSYGCDYHPSLQTQRNTANIVIPQFRRILGWK